jgi:hypothetical protein
MKFLGATGRGRRARREARALIAQHHLCPSSTSTRALAEDASITAAAAPTAAARTHVNAFDER